MQRVAIIGNGGGGKSLLARDLGRELGIPVRVVDDVQFRPGWVRTPLAEVAAAHEAWLREDRWVIDGWGAWELIERRFEAADTIVVVDFPLWKHYHWAMKRQVEALSGQRTDWPPPGCSALRITLQLIRVMWRVYWEFRPKLLALSSEERFRGKSTWLRSPAALAEFRVRAISASK